MKPSIAVMAALFLFGCTSDSLGGATGTGGAAGGAGDSTGAAGSGGTMATGGAGGTMVTGGVAGTGGRYSFCGYPDSTHCFPNTCGNGVRDTCPNPYAGTGIDCDNPFTEQCDGEDLGTATCANRNLGSGTLRCTSECVLDTSGCSGAQSGSGGTSASTARP